MATEVHSTGANRSVVENPAPTPRVSESYKNDPASIAPPKGKPFPERLYPGADPDKNDPAQR